MRDGVRADTRYVPPALLPSSMCPMRSRRTLDFVISHSAAIADYPYYSALFYIFRNNIPSLCSVKENSFTEQAV